MTMSEQEQEPQQPTWLERMIGTSLPLTCPVCRHKRTTPPGEVGPPEYMVISMQKRCDIATYRCSQGHVFETITYWRDDFSA